MALRIRKQYKNPDGTVTEIEGTVEEIAEYDRQLEKNKPKQEGFKKKKEILKDEVTRLTEESIEEFKKLLEKKPEKVEEHHHHHYYPQQPPVIYQSPVRCDFCGEYNCKKSHVWITTTNDGGSAQWIGLNPNANPSFTSGYVSVTPSNIKS